MIKYCVFRLVQKKCSKPPWNVQPFLKSTGRCIRVLVPIVPVLGVICCKSTRLRTHATTRHKSESQMSLSSLGNFSASGAATLQAPDCSSALGLYVPSVCLFFFTTQNSQARTAKTMARTPRMTVGATIAAMLGPYKCKQNQIVANLIILFTLWWYLLQCFTHCGGGIGVICKCAVPCKQSRNIRLQVSNNLVSVYFISPSNFTLII